MKRAAALASLSRDHHHTLVIAQALRRVTPESTEKARSAVLAYWPRHGRPHFELEEQVLLPAFAGQATPTIPSSRALSATTLRSATGSMPYRTTKPQP